MRPEVPQGRGHAVARAREVGPTGGPGAGRGDFLSLTGNLEDLPLLDIIQIVSFSKKTGSLAIRVDQREAAIVFQDGLVVCAYTWNEPPLDAAAAALPAAEHEDRARRRIGLALEQLIRLREGEFNFALSEKLPARLGGRDLRAETLAVGINPQELLLDLARGMDEDRRDSSAVLEASFASPDPSFEEAAGPAEVEAEALPEAEVLLGRTEPELAPVAFPAAEAAALLEMPSPVPIPEPEAPPTRRLLLVDDEAEVRHLLAERFVEAGYEVDQAEGPDDAIKAAQRLVKSGQGAFVLVTDLNMPASGGASFHGGFEVVKRLWKMNLRPPVLMMTDSLSSALRSRARQMGIHHFVFKPGLSKLDARQFKADLQAFAARLVQDVLPAMEQPRGPQPPERRPEARRGPAGAPPDEAARQMRGLQQQLEELRQNGDPSQISVLVMRVAREHFERAMLFLVKNDELRGLAGFGSAPQGESLNLLVRDVVIPLSEPSVFQRVVVDRKPFTGDWPDGKGGAGLVAKVGRFQARRLALLPLVTHRQTMALLLGDNPETGRDPARLESLEVFLDQAGTALENLLLQRKLQALQP